MKLVRVILIVLLLVCCTLWVASYLRFYWLSPDEFLFLGFYSGDFVFLWDFKTDEDLRPGLTIQGFAGFSTDWWPAYWIMSYHPQGWFLQFPFWLPTLMFALPLAISQIPLARRRRRAKQGLCIRCGYDLSGTDHTQCPECGEEIRKANPA